MENVDEELNEEVLPIGELESEEVIGAEEQDTEEITPLTEPDIYRFFDCVQSDLAQTDDTECDFVKNKRLSYMDNDVGYADEDLKNTEIRAIFNNIFN